MLFARIIGFGLTATHFKTEVKKHIFYMSIMVLFCLMLIPK